MPQLTVKASAAGELEVGPGDETAGPAAKHVFVVLSELASCTGDFLSRRGRGAGATIRVACHYDLDPERPSRATSAGVTVTTSAWLTEQERQDLLHALRDRSIGLLPEMAVLVIAPEPAGTV